MGRKPNQLILEFFERGPKLDDASNRYQHTCKSCGEKFPKGRIDSLTKHLVKKCPALPLRDRQRALMQFHDLPPEMPDMSQIQVANMGQAQHGHGAGHSSFASSKQGMSALETLAEVSRQHLESSGKRVPGKQGRASPAPSNNGGNQGAFDEFLVHDDRPDAHDLSSISQSMEAPNPSAHPSLYQFNGSLQHTPTGSPHLSGVPLNSSGSMNQMVPSLVMTASAANELSNIMPNGLMDQDLNMSNTGASDKFFHNQERQQWGNLSQSSIDPLLNEHQRDQMQPKDDSLSKIISPPRAIAMDPNGQAHFTTDFSMNRKPAKPKVRGRFSDTRRKEVQEIRKQGACIRCRMLKKPCSGDSPCMTCQNVESARLWKQPCIRTRIAEEFNLYSAGLHAILTFQAIGHAKNQIRLDPTPGRLEATHHLASNVFATFAPLKSQQAMAGTDIDPVILASLSPVTLEVIDNDDDIGGKLDLYVRKLASSFFECETSHFMNTTLRIALSITSMSQDNLLSKVLELWNLTRILTSRDLDWQMFSNPSLAPTMMPSTLSSTDLENPSRQPITPTNNPTSYHLIKTQLQGATEKRAACLARVVMNDLERRLLQRQQANPFETFLVAVILLACVERMCWLFRTWEANPSVAGPEPQPRRQPEQQKPEFAQDDENDHGHDHDQPQTDASLAQALQSASNNHVPTANMMPNHFLPAPPVTPRNPKWPFDKLPAYYSQQGERFSDILNMLLKMRGVPPKPQAQPADGMLVMWGEDVDDKVRQWYEGIAVTVDGLAERANPRFEGLDAREWELKFVSKIIGVV